MGVLNNVLVATLDGGAGKRGPLNGRRRNLVTVTHIALSHVATKPCLRFGK